jgi:hypothetical protein
MLSNFDILGAGVRRALYFKDKSQVHPAVTTTYKITLQLVTSGGSQLLGVATLDRNQVRVNADGLAQISLVNDLKIPADVAARAITSSAQIQTDIEIVRQGSRLNHGEPVVIKKSFVDRNRD